MSVYDTPRMKAGKLLNPRELIKATLIVIKRDGPGCCKCPRHLKLKQAPSVLLLDHRDNNPRNNPKNGSNWQLLCRSHNHLKNSRGEGRFNRVRAMTMDDIEVSRPQSAEMAKNMKSEPLWYEWMKMMLEDEKEVHVDVAVNSGAYVADVSPITISRKRGWLDKYTSEAGPWSLDKETQTIRVSNWRDEEEEAPPDIE